MNLTKKLLVACVATCLASTAVPRAEASMLFIDNAQSFLSIAVGAYDDSVDPPEFTSFTTPQVLLPPSDLTNLGGFVQADVSGTSITFTGGSGITFDNQPTPMAPGIGGVLPGSADAAYGLIIDVQGAITGPGAIRGLLAEVTSGSIPWIGTAFNAAATSIGLTAGGMDVNLSGFTTVVDTLDLSGNSGANLLPAGVITFDGPVASILIPIHVRADVPVEVSPGFFITLTAFFDGQIVASGTVPEPSTFVLGGMGLAGLGMAAFRRRKKAAA